MLLQERKRLAADSRRDEQSSKTIEENDSRYLPTFYAAEPISYVIVLLPTQPNWRHHCLIDFNRRHCQLPQTQSMPSLAFLTPIDAITGPPDPNQHHRRPLTRGMWVIDWSFASHVVDPDLHAHAQSLLLIARRLRSTFSTLLTTIDKKIMRARER